MDPNKYKTIENFVRGMIRLGEGLKEFDPDYIIAPMMGAVPFIDILNIVGNEFENEKVYYMPASNKIKDVKKVIRNWFSNFLEEIYIPNEIKIACLDEVVSGNSLVRSYKQVQTAISEKATQEMIKSYGLNLDDKNKQKIREELANQIIYLPFGIREVGSKRADKKSLINEYKKLLAEGKTKAIEVDCITTMDRIDFFPVTYKRVDAKTGPVFYPIIEGFNVSPVYINFLQTVAKIVGKDPDEVTLKNMARILESSKYLSDNFKSEY
ncbi:hypothetical protein HZC32_02315 [Candidatus Woesearchaeota archaeon]|nr:hypothetical protein [Candidatus Woesearchaeota archaeon]